MEHRLQLKKQVVDDVAKITKKANVCIHEVLRHFNIMGYIQSGCFGDVYGMGVGKDLRYTSKTYTKATKARRIPKFVMKVSYQSRLNILEVNNLKYVLSKMHKQTPHVPFYYKHFICNNALFKGSHKDGVAKSNEDWTYVKKGKAVITMMEYVGKSMDGFLKTNKNPVTELVMLFQLLYTIHVMQKHDIIHGDIHNIPNMTTMNAGSDANKKWEYKIDGVSYMVPVGAHIPILIDFGLVKFGQPKVTNKYSSDAYSLLKTWRNHTSFESVREFITPILDSIIPQNDRSQILPRYTKTNNIINDFFGMFLKPANSVNIQAPDRVWNASSPRTN